MRKHFKWLIPLLILALLLASFAVYTGRYDRADETALAALESDAEVSVRPFSDGWLFDGPSEEAALIFYPGAKVEAEAYAPLLHRLAEGGLDVFLVRMPFRLAVFGMDRAEEIMAQDGYSSWLIGGHSLGGAVAANFASAHPGELAGLVLCASYPTKPLDPDLFEISIYGTEDGLLNPERVSEGKAYAPEAFYEAVLEGANHAQFGNYGLQQGDGEARISAEEQQFETARFILEHLPAQLTPYR